MKNTFLLVTVLFLADGHAYSADKVDYLKHIKPLLTKRCGACHGALRRKSGLRLDAARLIRQGGDGGPAIEPGKSGESLLIEAVTGEAGFKMPPEGEPLTEQEISLLKAWIDQGAVAPADEKVAEDPRDHWSYQPAVRPPIPRVKYGDWVLNPIDAFVARQHDKRGLKPRPPADRAALLRRVYLDLIGLPPTREELHAFLGDTPHDAYERVVDRLLNSSRYGERWGRHWMDVWRYSDWYGSRGINQIRYSQRHIWRWRDWIIDSLNADKGYDRMIVEMLAGDEVAPTNEDVLRATGFLGRNWYKFDRNVWMRETVEHTAMGFLAITMKCARCHDHKFDPIAQKDYYRFRAFFEPHDFRTDPVAGQPDVLKDGLSRIFDAKLDTPTYLFVRGDDRYPDKSEPLSPGVPDALGNTAVEIQSVSLPLDAYFPVQQMVNTAQAAVEAASKALAKANETTASSQRQLAELTTKEDAGTSKQSPPATFLADDFSKPRPDTWKTIRGQWKYENGRLHQKQVTSWATIMSSKNHPGNFKARVRYRTTPGGRYRSIGLFFDMVDEKHAQAVYTSVGDSRASVQAFHRKDKKEVYPKAGIVPCELKLNQEVVLDVEVRGQQLQIWINGERKLDYRMPMSRQPGRFALWSHSGTAEFIELKIDELVPTKADALAAVKQSKRAAALTEKRLATARAELGAFHARLAAERAKFAAANDATSLGLAAGRAQRQVALAKADEALLQAEQQLAAARELSKSDDSKTQKAVSAAGMKRAAAQQAFQAATQALQTESADYQPLKAKYPTTSTGRRLALARWIANSKNPRTARVAVNHMWLRHFGSAIVSNMADFGLRSKPRSHPELLDWLAIELVENGWSMKHLHRLMVTSNVYRMKSSVGSAGSQNLAVDPDNQYLWRMNWRRMEAEVVRDSVIYLAGQLDSVMGGPELVESQGQNVMRRSLYFRMTPNETMEFLELFDLANPNECYRRKESVVPQQVLAMTNSAIALTNSRLLARRLSDDFGSQTDEGDGEAFVTAAFEQVLGRLPTSEELTRCQRFLAEHAVLLKESNKRSAFPSSSQFRVAPATDPALRARENLVHVLFNHNDFVTIR